MGRQTQKFPFKGKPIEFYRPTESQIGVLVAASKHRDQGVTLARFFQILEKLCVTPEGWAVMDDAAVNGDCELSDLVDMVGTIAGFEWPEKDESA